MSESNYQSLLQIVRNERKEYVSALTEEEKTIYLLGLLNEDHKYHLNTMAKVKSKEDLIHIPKSWSADVSFEGRDSIKLVNAWAKANGNYCDRCNCDDTCQWDRCSSATHGESYAAVDYNYGRGRGNYDIIVRINHYGSEQYGKDQDAFRRFLNASSAYKLWRTDPLSGPGAPGRERYFFSGNNDTPDEHFGAIGVEAFDINDGSQVWWGLWYFDQGWGDWGNQWLRCGQDYGFQFEDN